ncbi:MAG TPA: hypothetical protein VMH28_18680 [Candidatus Acidoferrales bacterium]|nr:hypothetical protein [Candidatus Acidoferrales bacterium]
MWTRFSTRLAGSIAIELALAGALSAGGFQAGTGSAPSTRALAIQDGRGSYAIVAQTDFRITQAIADFASAQVMQAHEIDRPAILLHWSGIANRPPQPDELVAAIHEALASLEPATIRYGHRTVSVVADEERCIASVNPDGALAFSACTPGTEIAGAIRAAFQMVEPAHPLLKRGETARAFPVQAIAIGKDVVILALSGEARFPEGVNPRGLIFAPFSNEEDAAPQDARVMAAVRRVLARVR